jgi:copper transport protein
VPLTTVPSTAPPRRRAPRPGRPRAIAVSRAPAPALARAAVCVLLAAFAVFGGAVPASAHAALTGSDPAQGAVVSSAPRQVTLTFSEGVTMSGGSIRVLDPHGRRVDTGGIREVRGGAGRADPAARRGIGLKPRLAHGTYTVAWQAVSADSHPVSGAFTFSVGAPSKTSAHVANEQASGAGGGTVGLLYNVCRYAAYTGFILLVGGACFVLVCWPGGARERPVRRVVVTGWVSLAAATLLMLALRAPYTGSGKLSGALDLGGLRAVLETKPGIALLSRLLLLGAAALFVTVLFGTYARRGDPREEGPEATSERRDLVFGLSVGGAVVAAGLAATWSTTEHASTGIQTDVAMPLDVVHLLAVAGWLGGLVTLLTVLHRGPVLERGAVGRFSRLAFTSVCVLAATGLYQAWRQVGSWHALTGTAYGQLLMIKVGLVAVLVAVGGASRRWTGLLRDRPAPRSAQGSPDPSWDPDPDPSPDQAREPGPAPTPAPTVRTQPERPEHPEHPAHAAGSAAAHAGTAFTTDPVRAAQLARQSEAVGAARRRKAREADPARSGLRRSVLAEAGIALVLLAVTTALTNTEPGRTETAARAADAGAAAQGHAGPVSLRVPFDTGGPHGKGTARLRIAPGRAGRNAVRVTVTGPGGRPLGVPEVKVALTLPARHLGPIALNPRPETAAGGEHRRVAGRWRAARVQVPMPGTWKAAVTVRTSDIDEVTETRNIRIG